MHHPAPSMTARACLPLRARLLLLLPFFAGCSGSGPTAPLPAAETELAVVLNSVERSLTVFPTDTPSAAFTVGLGPDGSPVNMAARGALVVVPMGTVPAVAVVDLTTRSLARTVPLPTGSGATGAAFLNDSIALVGNPQLNSVSVINVVRGTREADVPVGVFPQALVVVGDTVYVLDAVLGPDYQPAGPGTVTVLAGSPLHAIRTVALTGTNPSVALPSSNGRLYILNAGSFGTVDGSLSVVDRNTGQELQNVPGFGDFPGSAAVGPDGRLYVAAFSFGIAIWDPAAGFLRAPGNAIAPDGIPSSSGVGFDSQGRLYSLEPECSSPAHVFRLSAAFAVAATIPVGICPFGITFTHIPTP